MTTLRREYGQGWSVRLVRTAAVGDEYLVLVSSRGRNEAIPVTGYNSARREFDRQAAKMRSGRIPGFVRGEESVE